MFGLGGSPVFLFTRFRRKYQILNAINVDLNTKRGNSVLGLSASKNPVCIKLMIRFFSYNSVCQRKIIAARTAKIIDHSAKALRVAFLALSASHQALGLTP